MYDVFLRPFGAPEILHPFGAVLPTSSSLKSIVLEAGLIQCYWAIWIRVATPMISMPVWTRVATLMLRSHFGIRVAKPMCSKPF